MKHSLQLLILFFLIGLFESCSKRNADISPTNPTANFSYEIKDGAVTFTNKSKNAVKYLWDFGDGSVSMEKEPVHIYTQSGNYEVKLMVESNSGVKKDKSVSFAIENKIINGAMFSMSAVSYTTPCVINFINNSDALFFEWDFGDGGRNSNEKNPTKIYFYGGNYTITLTIKDSNSKILLQYKQQVNIVENLFSKINRTTIISKVKKDINKNVTWSDTTMVVYNDLNKISFIRSPDALYLFSYAQDEVKCQQYSSANYNQFYTLKFNSKQNVSQIQHQTTFGLISYHYSYDANDMITEIGTDTGGGVRFKFDGQNIKNLTYFLGCCTLKYDYEVGNSTSVVSPDILHYVLQATDEDINFFFDSFIYFYNTKPYSNLMKSVTINSNRTMEFTYFKDSQGKINKVITTNLRNKSTIETNITYQ